MNIKQAKKYIKETVEVYLKKDNYGNPIIPLKRQRPIFLYGPPGIGKTDIVSQVAEELSIGVLDYSMTHHTRQTVIGLPLISKRELNKKELVFSEYTTSEIVASIYEFMEETGITKGILFLDEINNVSETLHPTMLQLLQFKRIGKHRIPEDWIIVVAGNPPIYNSSSRNFDIVTWDRIKRIDVDANFDIWREYAIENLIHPSIISYLSVKEENFYIIETTIRGEAFVTGRSWEDLSEVIYLYEESHFSVDLELILQYIQYPDIARDYFVYYQLWKKYEKQYDLKGIIRGSVNQDTIEILKQSSFDENIVLLDLLVAELRKVAKDLSLKRNALNLYITYLQQITLNIAVKGLEASEAVNDQLTLINKEIKNKNQIVTSNSLEMRTLQQTKQNLETLHFDLVSNKLEYNKNLFISIMEDENKILDTNHKGFGESLDNVIKFIVNYLGVSNELSVLIVELSLDKDIISHINNYGSKYYHKYLKETTDDITLEEVSRELNIS